MLSHRTVAGFVAVALLITLSAPALAGGWAAVRLDDPPGDVVANEPWRLGFMVMQHDISPNSDVTPVLRAQHRESGDEITATGRQEGAIGHFVAEVTFPSAGEWKWSIEPQPYAETSFETLMVRESPLVGSYAANILTGSCAALGDIAFSLDDVEPQVMAAKSAHLPVAVGASTIDAPLPQLVAGEHAIGIGIDGSAAAPVACAEIEETTGADPNEVVLGLRDVNAAQNVGVAVLRDEGERTTVTLYLLTPNELEDSDALENTPVGAAAAVTIEMLDNWVFQPTSVAANVGDTVTWVNNSDIVHSVTGDDLAFADSGLIEPGETFSLTFAEPGTFHYRCAPHPGMAGVIVVT